MKRKLQKILMILTSCGLILTTAGCGASQTADTDTITQNEEDTTGASGTTKEKDADTDTDSKETVAAEEGGAEGETDDNTDEESGLTQIQTTDTAKTGTGVATSGTTGQKPAASGATATSGTTFQKPTASESSGTAGTTTSGTAATEATSGSGTSSAKDSSSGTSATATTTHTHNWVAVYKTIEHPEEGHYEQVLIGEEYTNPICEYHCICTGCGFDYTANGVEPGNHTCPDGKLHSYSTGRVITGYETVPAIYEDQWVVDKAAWSEQVVDYYQCSECGQTK